MAGVKAKQRQPRPSHTTRVARKRRGKQPVAPYPNRPLRQLYLRRVAEGKTSLHEVAVALSNGSKVDTSHVERMLGIRTPAASVKNGVRYEFQLRTHVERWQAAMLVRAMGVDPCDYDPGPGWPLL